MRKLNSILEMILDWIIAFIMVSIVIILFIGVVLRYVFSAPLFWAEEVTVMGLIWMTFLGGAILVRQDKHVTITVLIDTIKPSHKRFIQLIGDLLVMIILMIMIYQSWRLTGRLTESFTPAIRISEAWFGRALIAGFILMLCYKIQRLIDKIFKKELPSMEISKEGGRQL